MARACDEQALRALWILAALAACGNDHAVPRADAPGVPIDADPGPNELPCDVEAVLADACASCHSSPPVAGAPTSLTSRYDFLGPSSVDDQTMGARTAARLADATKPMPPASEVAALPVQVSILRDWIAAGMPAGSCGALDPRPAPTTCASGNYWTHGDMGAAGMNPGEPCRACHLQQTPQLAYYFAGTVFPSLHEEDLCNSPPPAGARVEILDGTGAVTMTLVPGPSGNFSSVSVSPGVPTPYTARLVANGLTREMTTPQVSGDCNGCHTEQGGHLTAGQDDAPGRLAWPVPRISPSCANPPHGPRARCR